MMRKQSKQIQMVILDTDSMIPEDLFSRWKKIYRSSYSDKNAADWISLLQSV